MLFALEKSAYNYVIVFLQVTENRKFPKTTYKNSDTCNIKKTRQTMYV